MRVQGCVSPGCVFKAPDEVLRFSVAGPGLRVPCCRHTCRSRFALTYCRLASSQRKVGCRLSCVLKCPLTR